MLPDRFFYPLAAIAIAVIIGVAFYMGSRAEATKVPSAADVTQLSEVNQGVS